MHVRHTLFQLEIHSLHRLTGTAREIVKDSFYYLAESMNTCQMTEYTRMGVRVGIVTHFSVTIN